MLKSLMVSPRMNTKRFIAVADLARSLGIGYDTLYSYIRRKSYDRYTLPTTGRTIYVASADADAIVDAFTNAESHAVKVTGKPKE